MPPKKVPQPIFVSAEQRQDTSLFGQFLGDLGLDDHFYGSGVTSQQEPARMIPDVGLSKGLERNAVWNDGTIAEGLSDDRTPGEEAMRLRKHISTSFSRIFADNKASSPAPVRYH